MPSALAAHRLYKPSVIANHENRHRPFAAAALGQVLDQLRERIRYLHYSIRTEQAYVHWVRAYIHFHGLRHPATLGAVEVERFLSWLANVRRVSASTHRQALAALLFFYAKVLGVDLPWMREIGRAVRHADCRWC